jgi:tRNA U54 and U55 pseudouridine synthase Pus10
LAWVACSASRTHSRTSNLSRPSSSVNCASSASPTGAAGARRAVAHHALADEIDVGVIVVGRPMAVEIIEESGPIGFEAVRL